MCYFWETDRKPCPEPELWVKGRKMALDVGVGREGKEGWVGGSHLKSTKEGGGVRCEYT